MARRDFEKYVPSRSCGQLIKRICPNLASLLDLLESRLTHGESIEVAQWHDDLFYIDIIDNRLKQLPDRPVGMTSVVLGLSVNVATDEISWVNDTRYNHHGGNCYVRSAKWKKLMKDTYGVTEQQMHFYKPWSKKTVSKGRVKTMPYAQLRCADKCFV